MEVVAFLFAFVFYMIVRVLLGHHKNQSYRDRQKYKKGIHLIEIKNYQEAIEYFRKIIHSNPNSAIALAYRGRCHLAMKNYYHALADCSKALNIDYNLKECYLDKGKAHYALQNYREAFCEFDKAIWHSGDKSAEAFRYRGLMNYHLGDYKKAENDFRNAVRLQDEDANYYLARLANRLDVLE